MEKAYLKSKGVSFEDVVLDVQQDKVPEFIDICGNMGVPCTHIVKDDGSEEKILGFDKKIPQNIKHRTKSILVAGKILKDDKARLAMIFILTFLSWGVNILVYSVTAKLLGIELEITQVLLIIAFTSLSSLVPSAPGFIGTFQAAFVTIFVGLGLDGEAGLSMSIILHSGAYISTILLGMYSIGKLNLSMHNVLGRKYFPNN